MIKLLAHGSYNLIQTKHLTKIIKFADLGSFAWINAGEIGEILVLSDDYQPLYTLASGFYRMYEVKNEPNLSDTIHLELFIGKGCWQGYLLPTNLPTESHPRSRIIPTAELITKSRLSSKKKPTLAPDPQFSKL